MENTRTPNRTNAGDNEVIMQDVARSGQDLSYISHDGGIALGRLVPITFQHLLPSAKYRLANHSNITFEQLSTPLLGNVDISQHNFFVPYRAIDKSFETLMTPTKLNSMGANDSAPCFRMSCALKAVSKVVDQIITFGTTDYPNSLRVVFNPAGLRSFFENKWSGVYLEDALVDLYNQICAHIGVSVDIMSPFTETLTLDANKFTSPTYQKILVILYDIFDFFVGKRSLLDKLGYHYVSHRNISKLLEYVFGEDLEASDFANWHTLLSARNHLSWYTNPYPLQNEYAIRAYYAIWFEYYRNFDIEPRAAALPEWKSWGATTIFRYNGVLQDEYNFDSLHYLVERIRCWSKDPFTAAGIDDISRHVFAPVVNSQGELETAFSKNPLLSPSYSENSLGLQMQSTDIEWRNPNTGSSSTLTITLPSGLLSQLREESDSISSTGVSLVNLRKAAMLENWLKRIYYGGDEYRDRMLSLYGARIEDYRINRPQWLSSSLDSRDVKQEVSNSGAPAGAENTEMATIGTRTATATATQNGTDIHSNFTPEFGIYIGILSVMPRATYDTLSYQNLQVKYTDFPVPQFANSMEDTIVTAEISRQSLNHSPFGYCAYGHAYRGRVDEVHGDYLDEKFDFVFNRSFTADNDFTTPRLSYGWLHCRPHLPMFVNSVLLDGQVYGTFMHDFFVENPLPTPVETI